MRTILFRAILLVIAIFFIGTTTTFAQDFVSKAEALDLLNQQVQNEILVEKPNGDTLYANDTKVIFCNRAIQFIHDGADIGESIETLRQLFKDAGYSSDLRIDQMVDDIVDLLTIQ